MGRIERRHAGERAARLPVSEERREAAPLSLWQIVAMSGLLVVGLALMSDGLLKDGVSMWIPTYLTEQFGLAASDAALATTVMPLLNMLGVFLTDRLVRVFRDELRASCAMFAVAMAALAALALCARAWRPRCSCWASR